PASEMPVERLRSRMDAPSKPFRANTSAARSKMSCNLRSDLRCGNGRGTADIREASRRDAWHAPVRTFVRKCNAPACRCQRPWACQGAAGRRPNSITADLRAHFTAPLAAFPRPAPGYSSRKAPRGTLESKRRCPWIAHVTHWWFGPGRPGIRGAAKRMRERGRPKHSRRRTTPAMSSRRAHPAKAAALPDLLALRQSSPANWPDATSTRQRQCANNSEWDGQDALGTSAPRLFPYCRRLVQNLFLRERP